MPRLLTPKVPCIPGVQHSLVITGNSSASATHSWAEATVLIQDTKLQTCAVHLIPDMQHPSRYLHDQPVHIWIVLLRSAAFPGSSTLIQFLFFFQFLDHELCHCSCILADIPAPGSTHTLCASVLSWQPNPCISRLTDIPSYLSNISAPIVFVFQYTSILDSSSFQSQAFGHGSLRDTPSKNLCMHYASTVFWWGGFNGNKIIQFTLDHSASSKLASIRILESEFVWRRLVGFWDYWCFHSLEPPFETHT